MTIAPATRPPDRRTPRRAPSGVRRVTAAVATGVVALRNTWAHARSGQRPLVGVLLVAVVGSIVLVSGPAERYLDGRERVEGLRATATALDDEIAVLESRAQALDDPDRVEALAREQQGMIRPGEVPYTLVPPEVERPRIGTSRDGVADDVDLPWYGRAWQTVRSWF